jgi:hypothetical protein
MAYFRCRRKALFYKGLSEVKFESIMKKRNFKSFVEYMVNSIIIKKIIYDCRDSILKKKVIGFY